MWKTSAAVLALLALAACDVPLATSAVPKARPPQGAPVEIRPTSEKSAALRSYFGQVQTAQLNQGLLRTDGGGPDTPYTADMLARNFEQIVFFNEYASALQGRGGESPLRKWRSPVRMKVITGPGLPPSQASGDTEAIRSYARRLASITGHPISFFGRPNFVVIVASEDDRDMALDMAAAEIPGITAQSLDALRNLNRDTYCAVAAYASGAGANTYTAAVALIRAENPGLLRQSCIHEELAQGLGLANDSRDARPSIFNDDDEFALLTGHDELLLRMLYDDRLTPGMTADQAAPITRIIARELTTGPL
ncbi:DUF2927 domain-containing protein [uncultured Roseobacter sp.]|uniref:DUF2927 domain-containing protein n=1 Tax=uncultured Roseobacter sp. TaxID=114847 RepID=UPI00260FEAEC|nr:DUF2927 domain-containing protein [uncultured Roseobacter sp.]